MKIFTIGFTKTSAENFFSRVERAGVKSIIDVRLRADSQLSGFSKKQDLKFFLQKILGVDYIHEPLLAPTDELLDGYKKGRMSWLAYENAYKDLIDRRKVGSLLSIEQIGNSCLLCSEALPHECHRRVAAEYLSEYWGKKVEIRHL